jgi:hypothetical protein
MSRREFHDQFHHDQPCFRDHEQAPAGLSV